METDFKLTYDPEKSENREVGFTMLDPKAMAKVAQAAQSAMMQFTTDPQKMFEFNSADDKGKEAMMESAKNSGYLVGPTVGGAFGTHHFNQFYPILKMKEKYNEIKAEGEALNGNGFANAVGGVVSVATGGLINAKTAAKFMNDNGDVIDTVASVAAVIAAPFTAGASLVALAAYKSVKGAFEGGALGALAGAATVGNAYLQSFSGGALSYDLSYSYDEGFGASVGGGYKLAEGLALGGSISYNEKSGFSGSVGLQMGLTGDNRLTLNAGVSFDQKGFTGADVGLGIGTGSQNRNGDYAGSLDVGLSYDKHSGFGQSVGFSESVNKYVPKGGVNVTNTAFGGVTASVTTPSMAGVTGGLSYNTKSHGFTASINALGANALNYDLENKVLTGNENFLADMAKAKALAMGGELSEEAKKKLAATIDKAYGSYAQGILEANPNNKELADAAGDPEAFQAKVKELDKDGKLNHPSDEFGTVDTGKSRSGFGVISGFFDDIGRSITGKETSFGSGYIDEKGKFHQRTCFVAGTLVTKLKPEYYVVADQLEPNSKYEEQVAIESIVVSDWVLSKNDETGETSYKRVANTFIRTTDAIYKVSLADGTTLETTWNHPFRVKKQGHALEAFSIENTTWVQAKDLHPGDVALGADGQELVITDIIIDERVETVYNFEVEEYHTYFVGEVGVWVHNDPFGYGAAMHYGNVLQLQACKDQACKEKVTKQITKANEAQIKIVAAEAVLLTGALACTYACPALILAGQNAINRIPSLLQNLGRSNPNAVQQEVKAGQEVAKGGSRVFEVGPYNTLKGVEIGLDAHHVGQKALMSRFIPGYNSGTAPSILVPKMGHTQGTGVLSRNTSGFTNAREVLSRDIFELRRVYSDVPNSSLQKLIEMNKTMYPGAFAK